MSSHDGRLSPFLNTRWGIGVAGILLLLYRLDAGRLAALRESHAAASAPDPASPPEARLPAAAR